MDDTLTKAVTTGLDKTAALNFLKVVSTTEAATSTAEATAQKATETKTRIASIHKALAKKPTCMKTNKLSTIVNSN